MYNYYAYEKHKKEEEKIKENEKKKEKLNKFSKKIVEDNNMINKYYDRLKDFVFTMANDPVPLTKYISPISSTRQILLQEEDKKIIGRRGMIFKSFITEKERLAEYDKIRGTIYQSNKIDILNLDEGFLKDYEKYYIKTEQEKRKQLQPFMRYKPRNDLERLFEAINNNSYGKVTKEAVENLMFEKMKKEEMRKLISNKDDEIDFEDVDYTFNVSQINSIKTHQDKVKWMQMKKKENEQEEKEDNDHKYPDRRRKKVNTLDKHQARYFLNDYNNKFHFKSASKYSLFFGKKFLFFSRS